MKRKASAAARVSAARADLAIAESALEKSARSWRLRIHRHREALVLFGGFASGLALTLLPPRWWARLGAIVGATAAGAARASLTPVIVGVALAQVRRHDDTNRTPMPSP